MCADLSKTSNLSSFREKAQNCRKGTKTEHELLNYRKDRADRTVNGSVRTRRYLISCGIGNEQSRLCKGFCVASRRGVYRRL